ncbi:MAG: ATP-dependent DNA helicase RecQ [Pirellulaceae bacterium]
MPISSQPGPRDLLRDVFGFAEFREGQEAAVSRLVENRSVLTVFPTGSGKSLCYQLPALMKDGLTLVISPLIALMKDQLDFLLAKQVPAARLDSTLDREATLAVYDQLNSGELKLLYVSPERLNNERFLHSMRRRKIALLAIDEAHCISEWGHNFRPDYLKIARLSRQLNVASVLALTATATPQVVVDICREFGITKDNVVHTGFYRPNLCLVATPCSAHARDGLLLQRLNERPSGPTVVYVTLQNTAERVAKMLSDEGYPAKAYHAGIENEVRSAVQDEFMASDQMIVVATIAFGMGVDKSDIRYVYHYNLPKSLESYSQEIGRAGRDGQTSICEMFACAQDVVVLKNFSYGDTPTEEAISSCLHEILGQGDPFSVSVYTLAGTHDIRNLVVKTFLTYLELDEIIQSTGPFYSSLKFQPQKTSPEILAPFDTRRAEFLRSVFRRARKGKTWWSLDVEEIAESIGETRDRIMAAITYLEERGDLIVQMSGLRVGYRLLSLPKNLSELARSLGERFALREQHDIDRVDRVVELAEQSGCLTRHLLEYFGEARDACGHCSRCEGIAAQPLPAPRYRSPTESDWDKIGSLLAEGHDALRSPRQITRFLCGLASPATTRAKLRRHALFGCFETVPFRDVLSFVEPRS